MRASLIPLGLLVALAAPGAAAPLGAAEPSDAGRRTGDAAAPTAAAQTAAAIDEAVAEYLADEALSAAPTAGDDAFLRRVTLDIAGRLPTPAEQVAFFQDASPNRRAAAIDHLLEDPGYAANWAAYWRDVIFKRATNPRANRGDFTFETWMSEQLADGRGWDEIATEIMTATGRVEENGATGLIYAQGATGGEVAAEASRIFLGVQIQCAECHDHPYDRWKREDFHALAAFFPRIRLRRIEEPAPEGMQPAAKPAMLRTYEVAAVNTRGGDRQQVQDGVKRLREMLIRRFRFLDADGDGGLEPKELERTPARRRADRLVAAADKDGDGKLNRAEVRALDVPPALLTNTRAGEHFMPDLQNPEEPGTLTDPRFFLTDETLPGGLPDDERRQAVSTLITGNEWFAKAVINRIFTQLTGEGFYTPVDDIGPDRSVRLEPALEALAAGFVENDHDLRWLIKAICLSDLYGRAIDADAPSFTSARPVRLRAHQIFYSVAHVAGGGDYETGLERLSGRRFAGNNRFRQARMARMAKSPYANANVGRPPAARLVEATFGFDPSTNREDLNGDIPQALALMNGQLASRLTSGTGPLTELLFQNPSDVHAVRALYRLILVRDPTAEEREIAVEHVRGAADRTAGFEDLAWALLNGAEFITRR